MEIGLNVGVARVITEDNICPKVLHQVKLYISGGSVSKIKNEKECTSNVYESVIYLSPAYVVFEWLVELPKVSSYERSFNKVGSSIFILYNQYLFKACSAGFKHVSIL